ncbi:MAG: hypothetical protein ACJ8FY_20940 [Gemmataceae bacterium]
MSLFGKLLAILNVLGAIGFVALAVMDWQARHQWTYAVFLHERAIEGLPLDDTEIDPDGNPIVKDISNKTQTAIVGSSTNAKTQVEEVNRVKSELQNRINDSSIVVKLIDGFDLGQAALAAPHQKLAYVLLPLASTIQEREELRNALQSINAEGKPLGDPEKSKLTETLQAKFDQAFNQAVQESSTAEGGSAHKRNIEERKQAVAHLLFCLRDRFEEPPAAGQQPNSWDSPSFQRVKAVVGLAALIHAIDDQFVSLQKMILDVGVAKQRDLDTFVDQQRILVAQARNLADQLRYQKNQLGIQEAERDKQQRLVKTRDQERQDVEKQLASAREETNTRLKEQTELEDVMYKALKDLRDLGRTNLQLEKRIRDLEESKKR